MTWKARTPASYGADTPGYLLAGQISNNPSTANGTTVQNLLTNYYTGLFGPAATNMEDYTVLFNGSAADPNLSSPPAQMSFDGLAFGAFGEPLGTFGQPNPIPPFNTVVSDNLALQQSYSYLDAADTSLTNAYNNGHNGSFTTAQYNADQARVDQIRMYNHFLFLEYKVESDYYGLANKTPAINSTNFNLILNDLDNVAIWVNDLVSTNLINADNFDGTGGFNSYTYANLKYFWANDPNGSNGLTTADKGLLTFPASHANPTQTVLNADWTADEAILAISAAPTNLTAAIFSSTENDLAWTNNAASPDNQTGLNVYRSTDDVTFSLLTSVSASSTTYHDTSVSSGTSYWYEIQSFNTSGNSIFNGPVEALSSLNAPSALTATAASSSQINLTWTDNDGGTATAYDIDQSTDGASFAQIATVAAGSTAYTNTGLNEGAKYYYEVDAVNATTTSAFSNIANAVTTLAAPSSLAAVDSSSSQINLSWTDNDGGMSATAGAGRSDPPPPPVDFRRSPPWAQVSRPTPTPA